jgi:hypothetical protein
MMPIVFLVSESNCTVILRSNNLQRAYLNNKNRITTQTSETTLLVRSDYFTIKTTDIWKASGQNYRQKNCAPPSASEEPSRHPKTSRPRGAQFQFLLPCPWLLCNHLPRWACHLSQQRQFTVTTIWTISDARVLDFKNALPIIWHQ